jgi:hypothetical protein
MSHISELKSRLDRLKGLVDDPHPCVGEWRRAFNTAAENLLRFFDHSVEWTPGFKNPEPAAMVDQTEPQITSGVPGDGGAPESQS